MLENDQILDNPIQDDFDPDFVKRNKASGGRRIGNYIIDRIVVFLLMLGYIGLIESYTNPYENEEVSPLLIFYIFIPFFYYWLMETLLGKTIGKFLTSTRIVKMDGTKPSGLNVLGRTLCRIIPFDIFSYLGPTATGWHDSIPEIYVIDDV